MVHEGVDQGAVRVAGGGVDHHAHGLVHHDHVPVLVDNVQGNILGENFHRRRVGDEHRQLVSQVQPVVFLQGLALPEDVASLQQLLGGGAGEIIQGLGQKLIRPLAGDLHSEGNHHALAAPLSPRMKKSTWTHRSTPPTTTPMSATLNTAKFMKVVANMSVT